jgi:hypothetical protein
MASIPSQYDDCVVIAAPIEIVEPFVESETIPVAERLEVAGAEMLTTELFVPERVRLIPESPIVEPDAVVFPAVLAPRRLMLLFSAAAPGAATDMERFTPAVFTVMEPEMFAPLNVVAVPA